MSQLHLYLIKYLNFFFQSKYFGTYQSILRYLNKQNFEIKGYSYEKLLKNNFDNNCYLC